MRRIIVSTYVTLDGVIDEPHEWSLDYFDDAAGAYAAELLFGSDALLMGRETYESFAATWPSRDGEFADKFNSMDKYVASTTLRNPLPWSSARVIEGDLVPAVAALKQQPGGDIVMYGTGSVAHALLRAGLIDEHRSWVHPLIRGRGTRLFESGIGDAKLELVDARTLPSGVVILSHRPAST